MDTIDLAKLAQALRAVPEKKETVIEVPLNEYLKTHLVPIFKSDRYPSLNELDFGQFEKEDLCDVAAYLQDFGRLEYSLTKFNSPISLAPAKAANSRTFI